VPKRLCEALPCAKLIVLLRDPVDRAFSHYNLMKRKGRETLSFEDAVAAEPHRLASEDDKPSCEPHYCGEHHFYHSYLARGIYADQLQRWFNLFPREQIRVIKSEELYAQPERVVNETCEFLGVDGADRHERYSFEQFNATDSCPMPAPMRERLADFFRPHNERLYRLLRRNLHWPLKGLLPFFIDMLDGHCDLLDFVWDVLG
jgi:hypothetical protein